MPHPETLMNSKLTEVKREIMSRYRVDALFINRWDGSGMCYCEHCRRNFRAASGRELPRTSDPQDPARRTYILWHLQRLFELWRRWDAAVRQTEFLFAPRDGSSDRPASPLVDPPR